MSEPRSITEAEMAAYYEQRGDVLDPKVAASAAFGVIGATREPRHRPGAYEDGNGNLHVRVAGLNAWLRVPSERDRRGSRGLRP